MNPAERLFRIHRLLKGRRVRIPIPSIQEELEVSESTVKRDLRYMRDFMGAPIDCARDGSGCYYDPNAPEFELPGLWFNDSELHALLASEQLLESVRPGLLAPHLGPLKLRIRQLLETSGHKSETVAQRIRLQPIGNRPADNHIFGKVAGATLDGKALDIEYHGRGRGTPTHRPIHPQRLIHYRDNWFVVAWCDKADALRTFALDRILRADVSEESYRTLPESDLDHFLGDSYGIFTGEANQHAILRFTAQRARWVADETWHPNQVGEWKGDNYELKLPYSDERELVMEILKYGPDVEVLAPESLRHAVANRIREAAARYES